MGSILASLKCAKTYERTPRPWSPLNVLGTGGAIAQYGGASGTRVGFLPAVSELPVDEPLWFLFN